MNYLKVIREPELPHEPNLDIVAVHGLNSTNRKSHAETTWTAEGKLWLRDFLPQQLPHARVLLYSYNANIAFRTSAAGVREAAENLLHRLKSKRSSFPDRPLLFVCHGLGGIVVKRCLIQAQLDVVYSDIRTATRGIAFFGTPHRGENHARVGGLLASVIRRTLRNPRNSFFGHLKTSSVFADDVGRDFRHQLDDYQILSFYETLPSNKLGLIVDPKSATLDLPGTRETQIALHTNHRNMCRFADIDGDDYEQVISSLVSLARHAVETSLSPGQMKSYPTTSTKALSLQRSKTLANLHIPGIESRGTNESTEASTRSSEQQYQSRTSTAQPQTSNPSTAESEAKLPVKVGPSKSQGVSIDGDITIAGAQLGTAIKPGDLLLIEHLNLLNPTSSSPTGKENRPISLAAVCGSVGIRRSLMAEGASVNVIDGLEGTALRLAIDRSNLEVQMIKSLLESGADTEKIGRPGCALPFATDPKNHEATKTLSKCSSVQDPI